MIVTAHQPAYLPWLGYFDKIASSDVFIYLDSVQFEKNSFINRNQIKIHKGKIWLTVPVKINGHMNKGVKDIEIDNRQNWRRKHLNSIFFNYKKTKGFDEKYFKLESFYNRQYTYISDLCFDMLLFWLTEFDIHKKIVKLSQLEIKSNNSDLILDICKHFDADIYISGKLGRNYLVKDDFDRNGISIIYQDYKHPKYKQLWGEFVSNLSILDVWMNCDDFSLIKKVKKNELFSRNNK